MAAAAADLEMAPGVYTALVTPFTEDGAEVDYRALTSLVEKQLAANVAGLVVVRAPQEACWRGGGRQFPRAHGVCASQCGSTGESPTLTIKERNKSLVVVITAVGKRCPVLAGVGACSACPRRLPCSHAPPPAQARPAPPPRWS